MTRISEQAGVRPAQRGLRHPTVAFFALVFGIAWAAWLPVAAESRGYFLATANATPLLDLLLKWITVGVVVVVFGAANLSRAERQMSRS